MQTSQVLPVPLSYSSAFQKGGIYDPTAANFPTCLHFWSCPQSDIGKTFSGASTGGLTDLMGRCHLLKATNVALAAPASIDRDGFSVFPNQSATANKMGSLSLTTGKYVLLLAVGKWGATSGINLGDVTSGAGISLIKANSAVDNSTNAVNGTAFTLVSGISGRALLIRTYNGAAAATTGMATFEANVTSTVTALGDAATTALTEFTAWGPGLIWACPSATLALHGMALFAFSVLPTDTFVKRLVAWHTVQWASGNKWLDPALKGVV